MQFYKKTAFGKKLLKPLITKPISRKDRYYWFNLVLTDRIFSDNGCTATISKSCICGVFWNDFTNIYNTIYNTVMCAVALSNEFYK